MKTLLLLLSFFCITKSFAQDINIHKRKPWEDAKNKMLQHKFLYTSVLRIELRRKYLRNNGKGTDVYAMMPYNMPCIVADSTFRSNMPVLKSERITARE